MSKSAFTLRVFGIYLLVLGPGIWTLFTLSAEKKGRI